CRRSREGVIWNGSRTRYFRRSRTWTCPARTARIRIDRRMNSGTSEEQDGRDMARLASGQDPALNDLMDRHAGRLFHYLIRQLQNETDAAELAQETFVRVYQNRERFRAGASFSAWLYTIATNLVKDRFRWRSRHPQVSLEAERTAAGGSLGEVLPETRPGPGEALQMEERAEAVRNAVAALPED